MRRDALVPSLLVLGTLLSGAAVAQPAAPAMSVDDVVATAVREHPGLVATRLEVEAAVGRVQQAGLRPNPTLELGGQKALSPDNNVNVGLSVPLDLNGRKAGRVGVAERELDMKRAQLADRERRLRADIRMKAGEIFAAQRNLETATELLGANRTAFDVVRRRVQEGYAPALDETLELVEVNRLEASATVLRSRVEILGLQLRVVAGLPAGPPLALSGDLRVAPVSIAAEDAIREAVERRSDVAIARADAAAAAARVRKEQADGRWDASVNVGYQRQDFGFDLKGISDNGTTRPIQDVFHYFGAGVSVTLPVRNRNQGNIAAARAETQAAERRQELMVLTVRQEVAAAFAQHAAAVRALDLYERGVRDVARRNLERVREAYGLGRGSLLDVIGEQRRYLDIENGNTDALKQVYDAGVEIERATGRPAW